MLCLAESEFRSSVPVWPVQTAACRPLYGSERLADDVVVAALDTFRLVRTRVVNPRGQQHAVGWLSSQRLHDVAGVERFVARAWLETTKVLNQSRDLAPNEVADLVAVLNRLRDLEAATIAHRRASAASLHRRSVHALFTVSSSTSTAQLYRSIPEQAAAIGFDRVLFSTVVSDMWHPQAAYNRDVADWSSRLLSDRTVAYRIPAAAAHRHTVRVDASTMLEHHELASGYSLWRRSKSKSFWMVPLIDRQRVVGMIHADCHLSERLPTQTEIEALQEFCQQVSPLVARHTAGFVRAECLSVVPIRDRMHSADTPRVVHTPEPPAAQSPLSLREIEVVQLMADGLTNLQIGRRLTITEGTVKSHVKRILKKTGSANRAEAVAHWYRSQQEMAV